MAINIPYPRLEHDERPIQLPVRPSNGNSTDRRSKPEDANQPQKK